MKPMKHDLTPNEFTRVRFRVTERSEGSYGKYQVAVNVYLFCGGQWGKNTTYKWLYHGEGGREEARAWAVEKYLSGDYKRKN